MLTKPHNCLMIVLSKLSYTTIAPWLSVHVTTFCRTFRPSLSYISCSYEVREIAAMTAATLTLPVKKATLSYRQLLGLLVELLLISQNRFMPGTSSCTLLLVAVCATLPQVLHTLCIYDTRLRTARRSGMQSDILDLVKRFLSAGANPKEPPYT